MNVENICKSIFAAIMSVLTYLFGGWDGLLSALITVISLDYITGSISAASQGLLNPSVGAKGIIKKVMYMAVVALAKIIDDLMQSNGLLRNASIYFFIANEGISILENASKMGFPIPKILQDTLERIKKGE